MHDAEIQREVRLAIERTDELSRGEHVRHHELLAQLLDAVRSSLLAIDEALGGGRSPAPHLGDLARLDARLGEAFDRLGPSARADGEALVRRLRALDRALTATAVEAARAPSSLERWAPDVARALCWTAASIARGPITRGLAALLGLASERGLPRDARTPWPAAAIGLATLALPWALPRRRRERLPTALLLAAGVVVAGSALRVARRRAVLHAAGRSPFSRPDVPSDAGADLFDPEAPQRPTHPGFAGTH